VARAISPPVAAGPDPRRPRAGDRGGGLDVSRVSNVPTLARRFAGQGPRERAARHTRPGPERMRRSCPEGGYFCRPPQTPVRLRRHPRPPAPDGLANRAVASDAATPCPRRSHPSARPSIAPADPHSPTSARPLELSPHARPSPRTQPALPHARAPAHARARSNDRCSDAEPGDTSHLPAHAQGRTTEPKATIDSHCGAEFTNVNPC
jgi:hypothetical protein